jgi:hypothetical protein
VVGGGIEKRKEDGVVKCICRFQIMHAF